MSTQPNLYSAAPWTNQHLTLFHGTDDVSAKRIASGPVFVGSGKANTDFGPGFYTTTLERQARMWAAQVCVTRSGTTPAVVALSVNRDDLGKLESLVFVRGDFDAEDYWSLVQHCRTGARDHGRAGLRASYDAVFGPVAAFWSQRAIIADGDQISFHTIRAEPC